MTIFKDGFDIVTKVSKDIKDSKLASEITQIIPILTKAQTENMELSSKNLDLEKKLFALEKDHTKEITELKEQLSIEEFKKNCDFDRDYGTYISKEDGQHYCTSCLSKGIKSPLQKSRSGWHCKVMGCEQIYCSSSGGSNIDPPPTPGYGWMGS
jgi:hypothetical protein